MTVRRWTWERRQDRRQRELQKLSEMAALVRPRIAQGDYQGAREIVSNYRTPRPARPDPVAPVIPAVEEESGGGGFLGKLKSVGSGAIGFLDAATETTTDITSAAARLQPPGSPLQLGMSAYDAFKERSFKPLVPRLPVIGNPADIGGDFRRSARDIGGTLSNVGPDFIGAQKRDFRERPMAEQIGAGVFLDPTNLLGTKTATTALRAAGAARQGSRVGKAADTAARLNELSDVLQGRVLSREVIGAGAGAGFEYATGNRDPKSLLGGAAVGATLGNLTRGSRSLPIRGIGRALGEAPENVNLGMVGLGVENVGDDFLPLEGFEGGARIWDEAAASVTPEMVDARLAELGSEGGNITVPGGRRYSLSKITDDAPLKAIADIKEIVRDPSTRLTALPPRFRKGIALVGDPSLTQSPEVYWAANASGSVNATLLTQFRSAMKGPVDRVMDLLKSEPPRYIGPPDVSIAGTAKHIFERPDLYVISPDLRQAIDVVDQTMWHQTSDVTRAYGVDVKPYISDVPGAVYLPSVPVRDSIDDRIAGASLSSKSRAKQRAYSDVVERMKNNPDFVPVTDLRELVEIHNKAMARNAANETFRLGIGGKLKIELMDELHPALMKARTGKQKLIDSLAGRTKTAERQYQRLDSSTKLHQDYLLQASKKRDKLLARATDRAVSNDVRLAAAKEMRAEARTALNAARHELTQAQKGLGRAGTAKSHGVKLKRLIARIEKLGAKYEAAGRDFDVAKLSGSQLEVPKVPSTRVELKAYWDQVHQVRADVKQAAREQADAIGDASKLPVGAEARAIETSVDAAATAKSAYVDEGNAIRELVAAKGAGAGDTTLAAMDAQLRDLDTRIRQIGRKGNATVSRRADKDSLLTGLRSALEDAKADKEILQKAYDTAGTGEYVFDSNTYRYLDPPAAKTVHQYMKRPDGFGETATNILDEIRSLHLSSDVSPAFIQGMMGVFQDPILAFQTVKKILSEKPAAALSRLAREEADDVAEYTFHTGRAFSDPGLEFRPPKGLAKIPKVGPKFKSFEENLWAMVTRGMYEQWKVDRDLALKLKPGISRLEAAAGAADWGSKVIPSMNQARRGVTPLRGAVERSIITSTSFAASPALQMKEMVAGVSKIVAAKGWQSLTVTEQLAVIRGFTSIGTMMTVSLGSAALAAESRNKNPIDAMMEALEPKSKYFMAIQLGNGHAVSIGGPLRGFVKAVAPGRNGIPGEGLPKWGSYKLLSPVSGGLNLYRNKDWRDNTIRDGDALTQLAQTMSYIGEQILPISVASTMEGLRTGETGLDITTNTAGGFLGANTSLSSPTEKLNQISRSKYSMDFYNLERHQQQEIQDANPDLWDEAIAKGSDARRQAGAVRSRLEEDQLGDDQLLLSGQMTRESWIEAYQDRALELRASQKIIYGDSKPRNETPLDRYFAAMSASEINGRPDWDSLDAWVAQQPEADQGYIDRNLGIGGTPLVREYRAAAKLKGQYYELPKYRTFTGDEARAIDEVWQIVSNNSRSPQKYAMLRALRNLDLDLDENILRGVRRRIMGYLKETSDRKRFRRANPELEVWFGRGPLTAAEAESLS